MKTKTSILIAALLMALTATALSETDDQKKAAKAFNEGIALFKKGNVTEAVKRFRHADALHPSWKIKYNIGQCEAALKRYGLAIEAFEQYLAEGGDEVPGNRRDEVLAELNRLRSMVGTISIHGEPGVDVYVDIIKRGNTSNRSSIKVTAGVEHQISFVKDGKKLASISLVVSGGEMVVVPVDSQQPQTVGVEEPSAAPTAAAPAQPTPEPATPVAVPAPPPPQSQPYTNMLQLKTDLRARKITEKEYRQHQQRLKKLREEDYNQLKADYRARKITEREYEQKRKDIRRKYEGK